MRTIQSELQEKGFIKTKQDVRSEKKKKITEQLSDKEWKELMGCNRDRFARGKGGAYRKR